MSKKAKIAKAGDRLVSRMDTMAFGLLDSAGGDNVSISLRLEIFQQVGRWIAVKEKLDEDDSAGALGQYKRQLRRDTERDERAARRDAGGGAGTPDAAADAPDPTIDPPALGGPALNKIRQELPRSGPGGISRDRPSAGGAPAVTFVRDGRILPVSAGVVESRRDEIGE